MVVKIGLIQMRCSNDPIADLAAAMENIRQAAAQGAQILCLPELFKTLYFCQAKRSTPISILPRKFPDRRPSGSAHWPASSKLS